jgi:hypothetical protein
MKYKSYENSAEEFASGLNTELLSSRDNVSARSVNRPLINILENQESNYNLIQTLLKTVYGNSNGIVPDVLESFVPEGFEIGSFKNDANNYFIRIPTGMMLLSKLVSEDYTDNNSNPFLKKGDYKYKDNVHSGDFLDDNLHSFVIENKPEINLYERELANLINLDLTDLTNDLRIYQKLVPMAVRVEIIDDSGNPRLSANGSPTYVTDNNSKTIYLAKPGLGDLDIYYGNTRATINSYNYSTTYDKTTNGETANLNNEVIKQTVTYRENLQVKAGSTYTNDISKALILKDASGNEKVRTGYYMNIVRATSGDDEVTWLPNKQQLAHWDVFLPELQLGSSTDVTANFYNENNELVETITFFYTGSLTQQELNDKFFGEVLYYSKNFNVEKIQANDETGNPIIGTRISVKNDSSYYDNYKITISYSTVEASGVVTDNYRDAITNQPINNLAITKAQDQQYFTNIFDLTNAFLGCFSSYFVNITNIYNYLNLETIIKIPNIRQSYALYYDLDGKLENQTDDKYDKTGRFYLTTDKTLSDNFIKLFEINVEPNNVLPNNPVVKSVKSFFDPLDRRLISTKRAELNSLLSTTRTELNNYVHIKDADGNREIEMTEKASNANNEQIRITSPITRITDVKDSTTHSSKATDSWADSGEGDTLSDFFEESYEVIDTTKPENGSGFRRYIHNTTSGKKGVVINKNKGISIFNYDSSLISGSKYSYSRYKPIEISSSMGNINLFNTSNENGRINIANFTDSNSNIVDIKGKTRIRSKNNDQLVIKKIGDINKLENSANIVFQVGNSKTKNDTDSLNSSNNTQNAVMGQLKFISGTTGNNNTNIVNENRIASLDITGIGGGTKAELKSIFEARNTKNLAGEGKLAISSYSSIVPNNNAITLGFPVNSRSYKFESNYIPYVTGEDVDANILASIKKSGNNYTGTSTEYIGSENRWAAAFINRGYFGRIVLSDTASDIKNTDARNGALRLGNSNIFDVSSLFINKTRRTINFDNQISNTSENTIYSNYSNDISVDGLFFFLNRKLGATINTDINQEPADAINYCALGLRTNGTHINKNAYIYRQAFINVNNGDNASTTENNSSLVVKGQTVLNGELIIGKDAETIDDTAEHTSSTSIIRNSSDKYKKYNEEYFATDNSLHLLEKEGDEYLNENKANWLYEFVNFGHSYFEKDITVKGKFTENTVLNRTLTILNHNYANYDYNEITPNCPAGNAHKVTKKVVDSYDSSSNKLPRNNVSFDIESGLIKFGSNTQKLEMDDQSDLELYGSQWIKRRLEINADGPVLRNTSMKYDSISDRTNKESPVFYVNGASQFTGDVVFGNSLVSFTEDGKTYKALANQKQDGSNNSPVPYSKVIFWGANAANTETEEDGKTVTNWHSDFDFHGKTWFDHKVRIGRDLTDHLATDGYEEAGKYQGSLEILGKHSDPALKVSGPIHFEDGQISYQQGQSITLEANSNADLSAGGNVSRLVLNDAKNFKDAELYSSGNIDINADEDVSISSGIDTNVDSAEDTNITSGTDTNITSGTDTNITSTEGNITLLAKAANKNIILKNEKDGNISLGNDTKTTNISLLTNKGSVNAKYKAGGNFKVTLVGTSNMDKVLADKDKLVLKTNDNTSIELLNTSNAINNIINSKADNFTHSAGSNKKIEINSTNSIFEYGSTSILTLSNKFANLTADNSILELTTDKATIDSTEVIINDNVHFGTFTKAGNTFNTRFDDSSIFAPTLNLVGTGDMVIKNVSGEDKTAKDGGVLTLNQNGFKLQRGENTAVEGSEDVLSLCGNTNIKFKLCGTEDDLTIVSFNYSQTDGKYATFDCDTSFNNMVNVENNKLKIGSYTISIS